MKKKLLILLTLIFTLSLPLSTNAANPKKVIYLEHGKTYKNYDVTGNRTKDKFKCFQNISYCQEAVHGSNLQVATYFFKRMGDSSNTILIMRT